MSGVVNYWALAVFDRLRLLSGAGEKRAVGRTDIEFVVSQDGCILRVANELRYRVLLIVSVVFWQHKASSTYTGHELEDSCLCKLEQLDYLFQALSH